MSSVSDGGRTIAKYTLAPQTNITIARTNGIAVHISSSASDPWIGAPTSSGWRRRYLIAKMMTSTVTTSAKNALTAVMKKYRLSTRGAIVDACSGKSGGIVRCQKTWNEKGKMKNVKGVTQRAAPVVPLGFSFFILHSSF